MINLLKSGFLLLLPLLLLSGCGSDGTPTRHNDFTPLTSIEIVADSPTIAPHTSTKLSAKGNYSGLFTRDITDQVTWSSDAPSVAGFVTPGSPNRATGAAPGTANLSATVGGVSAAFKLTVSSATVTAPLTITPATPTIARGVTSQFAARGTFSDGTTQDLTFDADWSSSAPGVATVSSDAGSRGVVHTLAAGTTTITATFTGVSGSTLLTVTEPALQSIAVSPASPTLLSLSTTNCTATGAYSDGSTADLTSQVVWSSSRTDIATITAGGTVRTLTPGTATISATLAGVSGTTGVKVTGGTLAGITITPANPKLVKGTVGRITATGTFSNGSRRDITGMVDWSVAVAGIATVTTPGGNQAWLTPVAVTAGTRVTAKSGSVSTDATLVATAPQPLSIAIAPAGMELTAGTSDRLTATATYSDGTTQDVTAASDWSSNAVATAAVATSELIDKGRVTGGAAGLATISVTYGGVTKTTIVTVKTRTLADLAISGSPTATIGNQVTFSAVASYSDGSSKDVTADTVWTIDKTNVVALADPRNQPGQVVMVDGGPAELTASFGGKSRSVTLTSQVP